MVSKLKIIPLGGLGEIGKNMTVFEFGSDIIVVDCGMGFPDEDMYGVDMVLPDISYLKANASHIRGIIITHGHEDHIGAVPYVLKELDAPIYTMPLTAALIELKLEEHDLLYNTQIFTKKVGSSFRLGAFTIEFINVNHSIPDAVALAIGTPVGTVIHTGDFKIDVTPIQGSMMDLARLGQLGNEGVLALLSDSTNVEKPGYSASERKVGASFNKLFKLLALHSFETIGFVFVKKLVRGNIGSCNSKNIVSDRKATRSADLNALYIVKKAVGILC